MDAEAWALVSQRTILAATPRMVDVKRTAAVGAVAPGNIYVIDVQAQEASWPEYLLTIRLFGTKHQD